MTTERYNQIQNYAEEHNLQLVQTTSQANGYPSGLEYALTDFCNINQFKNAEEDLGGDFYHLEKRDGWQLWYRKNPDNFPTPYRLYSEDLGYRESAKNLDELDDSFNEQLKAYVDGNSSFEEISRVIDDWKYLREQIEDIEENQTLFFSKDGNTTVCEIVDDECMSYYYDTHHHALALNFSEEGTL